MTENRAKVLTRHLKRYHRGLYAKYAGDGLINVCFSEAHQNKLVMSLTDNWSASGKPVPWGIEVVMLRLRQINVSENEKYLEELREERRKNELSKKRDLRNNIEAGLYENRRNFAKAFDGINTSILDKTKDKRRIKGA